MKQVLIHYQIIKLTHPEAKGYSSKFLAILLHYQENRWKMPPSEAMTIGYVRARVCPCMSVEFIHHSIKSDSDNRRGFLKFSIEAYFDASLVNGPVPIIQMEKKRKER